MIQAQEQLQADVLRYKAKIEDLETELTLKGQVGHTLTYISFSVKFTPLKDNKSTHCSM